MKNGIGLGTPRLLCCTMNVIGCRVLASSLGSMRGFAPLAISCLINCADGSSTTTCLRPFDQTFERVSGLPSLKIDDEASLAVNRSGGGCDPGQCSTDSTCVFSCDCKCCAAGSACPGTGAFCTNKKKSCPAGTFSSDCSAECKSCATGRFSFGSSSECTACNAGHYACNCTKSTGHYDCKPRCNGEWGGPQCSEPPCQNHNDCNWDQKCVDVGDTHSCEANPHKPHNAPTTSQASFVGVAVPNAEESCGCGCTYQYGQKHDQEFGALESAPLKPIKRSDNKCIAVIDCDRTTETVAGIPICDQGGMRLDGLRLLLRTCNDTDASQKFSYDKTSGHVHVPAEAFRGPPELAVPIEPQCFHMRSFPDDHLLDVNACSSNGTVQIHAADAGNLVVDYKGFFWQNKLAFAPQNLVLTAPVLVKPYCVAENEQTAHAYFRGGFIETIWWIGAVLLVFGVGPYLLPDVDGCSDDSCSAFQRSNAWLNETSPVPVRIIGVLFGGILYVAALLVKSDWSRPMAKWLVLQVLMPLLLIYAAFWYTSFCLNVQGNTQQSTFSTVIIVLGAASAYSSGRTALKFVRELANLPENLGITQLMADRRFKRTLLELEQSELYKLCPLIVPIPFVIWVFIVLPTANIIANLVKCTDLLCQLRSAASPTIGWFAMPQCGVPDDLKQNLLVCRCTGREPIVYAGIAALASLLSCMAGRRLHLREATSQEAIFNQLILGYTVPLAAIGATLWFSCIWHDETQEHAFAVAFFILALCQLGLFAVIVVMCSLVESSKSSIKCAVWCSVWSLLHVFAVGFALWSVKKVAGDGDTIITDCTESIPRHDIVTMVNKSSLCTISSGTNGNEDGSSSAEDSSSPLECTQREHGFYETTCIVAVICCCAGLFLQRKTWSMRAENRGPSLNLAGRLQGGGRPAQALAGGDGRSSTGASSSGRGRAVVASPMLNASTRDDVSDETRDSGGNGGSVNHSNVEVCPSSIGILGGTAAQALNGNANASTGTGTLLERAQEQVNDFYGLPHHYEQYRVQLLWRHSALLFAIVAVVSGGCLAACVSTHRTQELLFGGAMVACGLVFTLFQLLEKFTEKFTLAKPPFRADPTFPGVSLMVFNLLAIGFGSAQLVFVHTSGSFVGACDANNSQHDYFASATAAGRAAFATSIGLMVAWAVVSAAAFGISAMRTYNREYSVRDKQSSLSAPSDHILDDPQPALDVSVDVQSGVAQPRHDLRPARVCAGDISEGVSEHACTTLHPHALHQFQVMAEKSCPNVDWSDKRWHTWAAHVHGLLPRTIEDWNANIALDRLYESFIEGRSTQRCPAGHKLKHKYLSSTQRLNTFQGVVLCSNCSADVSEYVENGSVPYLRERFTCRACDYDLCTRCVKELILANIAAMRQPTSKEQARTMNATMYHSTYVKTPKGPLKNNEQMWSVVSDLIAVYCADILGRPVANCQQMASVFTQELQSKAAHAGATTRDLAMYVWTSHSQLRGPSPMEPVPLFSIIQNTIRQDGPIEAMKYAVQLARWVNELCIEPEFPPGDPVPDGSARKQVYRGTGFDNGCREFFTKDRKYRVPAYLATSTSKDVAMNFMRNAKEPQRCMWYIQMSADRVMYNAALVRKSEFAHENEYLFTPYSVFTVEKVRWDAGTKERPHEIWVVAASDNRSESGDLGLARWY